MLKSWLASSFVLARLYALPLLSETDSAPGPLFCCTATIRAFPLSVAFGKRIVYELTTFPCVLDVFSAWTSVGDCALTDDVKRNRKDKTTTAATMNLGSLNSHLVSSLNELARMLSKCHVLASKKSELNTKTQRKAAKISL